MSIHPFAAVEPSEHNLFSQTVHRLPSALFLILKACTHGHPEPTFSDISPFLDNRNRFLGCRSPDYPDNWKSSASGTSFTLTPQGGVVKDPQGQAALAYGVMFNQYEPKADNAPPALDAATDQLIASLQKSNPGMRIARARERIRVDGEDALSIYLANSSPVGGEETDWVVTVLRPDGLFAFICVAPQKDWDLYSRAFQDVVSSINFRR